MKVRAGDFIALKQFDERMPYYDFNNNCFYITQDAYRPPLSLISSISFPFGSGMLGVMCLTVGRKMFPHASVLLLLISYLLMYWLAKKIMKPVLDFEVYVEPFEYESELKKTIFNQDFRDSIKALQFLGLFLLVAIGAAIIYFQTNDFGLLPIAATLSLPVFVLIEVRTIRRPIVLFHILKEFRKG